MVGPPLFYFADPARPVWEATRLFTEGSAGPEIVTAPEPVNPPFGMVTTQTCDIAEEDAARPMRPWVQVAPIYEVTDGGWKKKLQRGAGPRYWLLVPGVPADGTWAADLRVELAVEKGWLAAQTRIAGFDSEAARSGVGARLAWLRGRPAFSSAFNSEIHTPVFKLIERLGDDPTLCDEMAIRLKEIAVAVDSYLAPSHAQLVFISSASLSEELSEAIRAWHEDLAEAASEVGIVLQAASFRREDELTIADYHRMSALWTA